MAWPSWRRSARPQGDASQAGDVDLLYVLEPGTRLSFAINRLEDGLAELFDRGNSRLTSWRSGRCTGS